MLKISSLNDPNLIYFHILKGVYLLSAGAFGDHDDNDDDIALAAGRNIILKGVNIFKNLMSVDFEIYLLLLLSLKEDFLKLRFQKLVVSFWF